MESIQQHITRFIEAQTVASVACLGPEGTLHSFSCYYAYDPEHQVLYFKSNAESLHMRHLDAHPVLSGTILPDKLNKLKVQGIQFTGHLLPENHRMAKTASRFYHKRFPLALPVSGTVYTIRLDNIKMTDNTLGFGTKLVWDRVHSAQPLSAERSVMA